MRNKMNTDSTNQNPLVSVIIDNYNYGRFIKKAIDSVLHQTYRNFELIVVDDGSTDNSREIIEGYQDKLIAIFQENGGQNAAFNTGFARSKGEIICFLDSDDIYYKDKLAKVVAAFNQNPEWVQISHGRTTVDAEGGIVGRDPIYFNQGDVKPLLLQWGRYAWAVTSALSYRRSVLEKVLPFPKQPTAGDTYLTATVPFYGQIGKINQPLMYYRKHGNNVQANSNNLTYLIKQREDTANCINNAASKIGINQRFDLKRDIDYRSFKILQSNRGSLTQTLQIIWMTLQEGVAIGHSFKDTSERLVRRSICALFPDEGKVYMTLGLRRYLRFKLTGIKPQLIGKKSDNLQF
ncbi:MAG: glycosyltransferase [Richelia sp. SL_2_1]|nr:glycosyltransferase [Richelia sp. SM1_7_0]NJN11848.1 glycosyltransferase [Richelia sp. RM1_1_1]NJO29777.1 glycosyltransferase [Richelia sp. SL_2_1]